MHMRPSACRVRRQMDSGSRSASGPAAAVSVMTSAPPSLNARMSPFFAMTWTCPARRTAALWIALKPRRSRKRSMSYL
eukprot:scaffold32545_cov31-Tisochrysis_lutea.AAC.2